MRLAVVGASGRMGRAVVRLAQAEGFEIACAVAISEVGRDAGELAGIGPIGTCIVDGLAVLEHARASVVVDFSTSSAMPALASVAAAAGSAFVSGTTGLGVDARSALQAASTRIPVLWEPNMSLGVHLLGKLVARAAQALSDWDVEIVETHHRGKVDAPSGTALRLAELVGPSETVVYGRHGRPGPRRAGEIGIHALRGGDVVGDHAVHFLGGGERLELTHRATSRDVFAHGALRVARWIAGRSAGVYTMDDVLGAKQLAPP